MISEVENVLKATIVISPEYEAHARKVVVKEANIKPNENGVVPLGKDGAFEHDEEEVLDFIGPSKAGPLQEPKPSDTIEEAPVLTEDPSRLEEVVNPIKEELEKIQNKDVVKEEIKDEAKNEIVSPLGVTMPEIETPIANEPNLDDSSLFSIPGETPEPETVKEPVAEADAQTDTAAGHISPSTSRRRNSTISLSVSAWLLRQSTASHGVSTSYVRKRKKRSCSNATTANGLQRHLCTSLLRCCTTRNGSDPTANTMATSTSPLLLSTCAWLPPSWDWPRAGYAISTLNYARRCSTYPKTKNLQCSYPLAMPQAGQRLTANANPWKQSSSDAEYKAAFYTL